MICLKWQINFNCCRHFVKSAMLVLEVEVKIMPKMVVQAFRQIEQINDKMPTWVNIMPKFFLATFRKSALCRQHFWWQHIASRHIAFWRFATHPIPTFWRIFSVKYGNLELQIYFNNQWNRNGMFQAQLFKFLLFKTIKWIFGIL